MHSKQCLEVLKGLDRQSLRKDVQDHILGRTIVNFNYLSPDRFLDEMVSDVNVLRSSMILIILGDGNSWLVVTVKQHWLFKGV